MKRWSYNSRHGRFRHPYTRSLEVFSEARVEFIQPSQFEVGHALFLVSDVSARADLVGGWHLVNCPLGPGIRTAAEVIAGATKLAKKTDEAVMEGRGAVVGVQRRLFYETEVISTRPKTGIAWLLGQ